MNKISKMELLYLFCHLSYCTSLASHQLDTVRQHAILTPIFFSLSSNADIYIWCFLFNFVFSAAKSRHRRQVPYETTNPPVSWSEAFGEGTACVTQSAQLGLCLTFRSCYPYFKVPDLSIWDTWVLGNYDSCAYFNKDGRQTYGVCCTNPHRPPLASSPPSSSPPSESDPSADEPTKEIEKAPVPHKDTIFSNWPPPLPTHPPNHHAPTHPTHPTHRPPAPTHRPPTTMSPYLTTTEKPNAQDESVHYCGMKNGKQDQERIVGGHNADPNEWPWIAVLFNGPRQFCGGSLIDNDHILTAAHCVAQ